MFGVGHVGGGVREYPDVGKGMHGTRNDTGQQTMAMSGKDSGHFAWADMPELGAGFRAPSEMSPACPYRVAIVAV